MPLENAEREQWKTLPQTDEGFAKNIGVDELFGETGYTTNERRWARPTFDINGMTCGHQGEGVKTIIPSHASAKFSFRLVARQDPRELTRQLTDHLSANTPPGVNWELKPDHGAPGMLAKTDTPFAKAASQSH